MASIKCGHCRGTHNSVADVYSCFAQQQWEAEVYRQESASERYFEDRGFDAAREQEYYEHRNGVVGFREAWDNWNRAHGITDDVDGLGDVSAAERINDNAQMFGSAYAQISSYEDYMEREREAYYS